MTASEWYRAASVVLLFVAAICAFLALRGTDTVFMIQAGLSTIDDLAGEVQNQSRLFWTALVCGATGALLHPMAGIIDAIRDHGVNADSQKVDGPALSE